MSIERDADDIARCFLLERWLRGTEPDEAFEGEVVGLIGAGAFVAFGPRGEFEGLLPVRRMRGDWWELNEQGTMLVGTRSGGAIRLGDPLTVRVGSDRRAAGPRRPAAGLGGGLRRMAKGGKRRRRPATSRPTARRRTATTCSSGSSAGIVLTGTEVKSLREGKAQLKDSYAVVRDGEVWLIGLYIAPYGPAARENHDPERPRKLLLHRCEIERLIGSDPRARADARADADLLLRSALAGEGRDRAGARQGPVRQARDDPQARHGARRAAGAARGA